MSPNLIRSYAAKLSEERGVPVTPAEAEEAILEVVCRVAKNMSRSSKFGYYTDQDMEQEGVVEALQVLNKDVYDAGRPLENFLHVHLHHRLKNLKRRLFFRSEPPCSCCDAFGSPSDPCPKWLSWRRRNAVKQNLMWFLDVSAVSDEGEPNMSRPPAGDADEVLAMLDRELPGAVRPDYLRLRAGLSIPQARREKVQDAVLELIPDLLEG